MTKDSAWVLAQFALAWVLVLASAAGLVLGARGFPAILFWAVLPGAAASFVINGLVMRRHGDDGLVRYEKIALVLQVVVLAALVAVVLGSAGGTGTGSFVGIVYGTPLYAVLAVIVLVMAVDRNRQLAAPDDDEQDDADVASAAEGR